VLYVPHDCVGQQKDPQVRAQVAEDLQWLTRGLQEMFCLYGLGAKVTSGFGRAEDKIEGKLVLRAHGLPSLETDKPASQKTEAVALPKYLEAPDRLKPEYLNPDGTFRERSEAELKQMGKMSRWEYDKARRWWQTQSQKVQPAEPESKPTKPAWPEVNFKSFDELEWAAKRMADALQGGDAK
jgi:CRISPR-associated protein Cmr2